MPPPVPAEHELVEALQMQAQLGLGSYKTAWLLGHKLRRAMVDPNREPLAGVDEVDEVDEASIPFRTKDGRAGRIRLARIENCSAETLTGFIGSRIGWGAKVVSDGWSGYQT